MPKQKKFDNNKLKNKRGLGATPRELPSLSKGSKVSTNFKIKWTRSAVIFYSAIIVIPFLAAVIITVRSGSILGIGILLLLVLLVGLLYFVIRKIDQDDF